MSLPFKPHIIALLCSAGLLAAAGTLYVQSRTPATIAEPPAQQAPAPAASTTQPVAATYTRAQIDQWVAPIALYPDSLLSQVLMASTYPDNVLQAVQWSRDNPAMKGCGRAGGCQPAVGPSVKSLVAFPALLAMMGENPPRVENLGNAFLAQPHDVMDSVQRLRAIAQQTGTLKSTPQQKVIVTPAALVSASSSTAATATAHTAAPAPTQVIKIEPTNPQVVYVPSYNPSTVYGTAEQRLSAGLSAALPGSSLPIASSKASGTASAWPPHRRCSAVSTGMMMTITITMTTTATAITRIMAITSILM